MTKQTKQVKLPEEARKIITDISLGSEMSSEEKLGAIARLEGVLSQAQQKERELAKAEREVELIDPTEPGDLTDDMRDTGTPIDIEINNWMSIAGENGNEYMSERDLFHLRGALKRLVRECGCEGLATPLEYLPKQTKQVELVEEVGVIVSKIDDIIRSEWGASIYKEVGGADIAGQIEKVVSTAIAQAQQEVVRTEWNDHRQQLIKEVRLAIEGMRSKSLSHACLKSWGGCDCGSNNKLIDDILALEILQENPPTDK